MKRYKLLKDLPGWSAGTTCEYDEDEKCVLMPDSYPGIFFNPDIFPDWFEEIKEPESQEEPDLKETLTELNCKLNCGKRLEIECPKCNGRAVLIKMDVEGRIFNIECLGKKDAASYDMSTSCTDTMFTLKDLLFPTPQLNKQGWDVVCFCEEKEDGSCYCKEGAKPQEKEECKHEAEVCQIGRWSYHCYTCGFDGIFTDGILEKPKKEQLKPSQWIGERANETDCAIFRSTEQQFIQGILDFLDQHFSK